MVSPIRGELDEPATGDVLARALPIAVRGWALEGLDPLRAVDVVLDGERRLPAELGLPRPDVPAGLNEPEASTAGGWIATVDLFEWPHAAVRIQVVARARTGDEVILADRVFAVNPSTYTGTLDVPSQATSRVLDVRGWAMVGRRGPRSVDIEVDGVAVGRARLRVPARSLEPPLTAGPFPAFDYPLILDPEDGATTHTIDAVVTGADGSRTRMGEQVARMAVPRTTPADAQQADALRRRTEKAIAEVLRDRPAVHRDGGLRLTVFTHQLNLGGGQLYLQELLRQLVPSLASCTVFCPFDGELRSELEDLGVDVVITVPTPPSELAGYEGRMRELSMLILSTSCDVVLVNALGDFPAVDAASRLGIPTVWAIHESFEIDHLMALRYGGHGPHPYVSERLRASLRAATRLVFESQATTDLYAPYADADRRLMVPYGVDIDGIVEFSAQFDRVAARNRHDIPANATVLLCVGMVEERKSQSSLVEAFAEAAAAHPDSVLVLVGDTPGPYSTALHRAIDDVDLADRVRLLPSTNSLWEWYALSDVLVSASDVESTPRSMLEAMAFGMPILAAAVFGVPEIVRDGENGWLFEHRDMQALAAALDRALAADAQTRRRLGAAGRSEALERFRSTNYGQAYAALLRELTSTPAAP
jgi:glycosyltransferase involved in cell wall biosynthesis